MLLIGETHTSAYHPQGDGLVERLNQIILALFATTTDKHNKDWESHLAKVCFTYNTSSLPPSFLSRLETTSLDLCGF